MLDTKFTYLNITTSKRSISSIMVKVKNNFTKFPKKCKKIYKIALLLIFFYIYARILSKIEKYGG